MLNKFFVGIKDIWFCTKYFAKFAWKHLPIYYLYILMSVIISTAGPFVSIIGSKYLINEIVYEQNRNSLPMRSRIIVMTSLTECFIWKLVLTL